MKTLQSYLKLPVRHPSPLGDNSRFLDPASQIISGLLVQAQGKSAQQHLQQGLKEAKETKMLYFEALTHQWIGLSSGIRDNQHMVLAKLEHRDRAMDLFVKLEVFETMLIW